MNLLTIEHLTKSFTERKLFDNTDFSINEGDKIGVIGVNGTGKSTLLKIIAGLETADDGKVTKGSSVTIRYLPQQPEFDPHIRVLDAVMEGNLTVHNEWSLESEARTILNTLKIPDPEQKIGTLSGGQKKRTALAKVLLSSADILILDEPTNHLDNEMSEWLEDYLLRMKSALLMVTHDRYFMDRVVNRIVELDKGKIYSYPGAYSEFVRLKAARQNLEIAAERKRSSILRTELEWLMRGARARSTKQKAHIQRIEEMQQVKEPVQEQSVEMSSGFTRMGRKTIELCDLSKSYGDRLLFREYTYIFLKGERVGIVGENGCGKSTLLKIITGYEPADTGTVEIGDTVSIGYFSQDSSSMDPQQKVIDYIRDVGEYINTPDGKLTASMMLERFLFDGAAQWSPIGKLSGGERRRLQLLRVLMSAPNVLILDEPTNDLDIRTLTILEDYLDSFDGIVITVSHDRYFLDRIVRRIFAFEENGKIRQYEGNYSDYLLARQARSSQTDPVKNAKERSQTGKNREIPEENSQNGGTAGLSADTSEASGNGKNQNGRNGQQLSQRLKFSFKEQREFETIEEDIEALENVVAQLDEEISSNASFYTKLTELTAKKEKAEQELEEKMERWEYLTDLAERIEAQKKGR